MMLWEDKVENPALKGIKPQGLHSYLLEVHLPEG
jgi:hypothetical protein